MIGQKPYPKANYLRLVKGPGQKKGDPFIRNMIKKIIRMVKGESKETGKNKKRGKNDSKK